MNRRIRLLRHLALASLALFGLACGEEAAPPGSAPVDLLLHGRGAPLRIEATDPRHGLLLTELDSLCAAATWGRGKLTRRDLALAFERGALEYRFASPHRCLDATGDSLAAWRALLPLGVEPGPPAGESGTLLLLGHPDYSPRPLLSRRGRDALLGILEGRSRP